MLLKQSTARNVMVLMVDSTDHISGKTGLTLTITASKDGAAFASISPTVTDRGSGWYNLALTTSHTDTLGDFALHVTGTGADATDRTWQVVSLLPGDAVAVQTGTGSGQLSITSGVVSSNVTQIDGQATTGNNATLNLKQLNITNSAGTAFIAKSTGSNGIGMDVAGHGTSSAAKFVGGSPVSGAGADAVSVQGGTGSAGNAGGNGFASAGGAAGSGGAGGGDGMKLTGGGATSDQGTGLEINGATGATAFKITGNTGTGVSITGYTGLSINSPSSGSAVDINCSTSAPTVYIGHGGTSDAVKVEVTSGNGNSVHCLASGTGSGVNYVGGSTGSGLKTSGGATSGHGIQAVGTGGFLDISGNLGTVSSVSSFDSTAIEAMHTVEYSYKAAIPDQTGMGADEIKLSGTAKAWDDAYKDLVIAVESSGGSWQDTRRIISYTGSTKIAKVNRAFDVTPTLNDIARISRFDLKTVQYIRKNTAYNNFSFVMYDSTNHLPATGLTVTPQRSIDGGSYAACSNSVSAVGNGTYKINLSASDLNGDNIKLKFTATGADQQDVSIVTQS